MYDLVIAGGTLLSAEWGRHRGDVGIVDDHIAAIAQPESLTGETVIDASGQIVMPGVIDPHVHHGLFRPLDDDVDSESRSGLVGGVTTVGNIYRRGEPYRDFLEASIDTANANYRHDYFMTLGILSDTHLDELAWLVDDLGVTSFKWYGNYKLEAKDRFGVERNLLDDIPDRLIEYLSQRSKHTTVAYHAENAEITGRLTEEIRSAGGADYQAIVDRFPDYAEAQAAVAGTNLAYQHGYDDRFYLVHVSAAKTASDIADLHELGYEVTAETCPHYLVLTSEECDQRMRINPPIRSEADQAALWKHLQAGTIDCVGTDHIATSRADKLGDDIWDGDWGSPSSATLLPLLVSEGVNRGRLSLRRLAAVTTANPAKAYGLYPRKGSLRIGSDADLVILDLGETKTVTPELLQSAADFTMYDGWEVTGWPTHTIVRGSVAYEDGTVVAEPGLGDRISRPMAGAE